MDYVIQPEEIIDCTKGYTKYSDGQIGYRFSVNMDISYYGLVNLDSNVTDYLMRN